MKKLLFKRTYLEAGRWRGWLHSGRAIEVCWPTKHKSNWPGVALQILIHSNDEDTGDRLLNLAFGPCQVFILLGTVQRSFVVGDEPNWGFSASREFGFHVSWGLKSKCWDWAFRKQRLSWEYESEDGSWKSMMDGWAERNRKTEEHPYSYPLKNGETQNVTATVARERTVIGRRYLHRIGWPVGYQETIDVRFSGEVGERAGSWKGGVLGCGYTAVLGETPLETLRRMERDRKFT